MNPPIDPPINPFNHQPIYYFDILANSRQLGTSYIKFDVFFEIWFIF